jgi:hypothetical protein
MKRLATKDRIYLFKAIVIVLLIAMVNDHNMALVGL